MKVEMKLGILISFFTVFFLLSTSVLGQDEATTTGSDNVVVDATVQGAEEIKPENELETTPNTPDEITWAKKESEDANSTEVKSATGDNVNPTQENVTPGLNEEVKLPEAQQAAEQKMADQNNVNQNSLTLPPNEEIQVTEANAKDVEPLIEEGLPVQNSTVPPSGEGILPTDDKTLLKTLSGMTDGDEVKQPVEVKKKDGTSAENQGGYIEREDQLEPEGNVTKIEPEDQEQQEVNIVFPNNNPIKEDEFERMAKQIKPNKDLDEKLAKKLAGDYGEHIDHNKEDEQPNFVFPTQQNKSDQGEPMKIESEAEISDNDEKTRPEEENKRELKDVRNALPMKSTEDKTDGKSTNTSDDKKGTLKAKPQNAMILDGSEAKQIKPNKDLDEKLAKKLAGDYGEHIDHNKEDEQPNFVIPTQQNKSDQGEPMKIESEAEISDNDEKTRPEEENKRELKDVRNALPMKSTEDKTDGKSTNTSDDKKGTLKAKPQNAMILDGSEEQPNEPTTREVSEKKGNENSKIKIETEDSNEEKTLKKQDKSVGGNEKNLKPTEAEHKKVEHETRHNTYKTQNNKTQQQIEQENTISPEHNKVLPHEKSQEKTISSEHNKVLPHEKSSSSNTEKKGMDHIQLNKVEKPDHIQKKNVISGNKNETPRTSNLNKVSVENKNKQSKPINKAKSIQKTPTNESSKTKAKSSKVNTTGTNAHEAMTEEELVKNAIRFEKIQPATTELPAIKVPKIVLSPTQANQNQSENDGTSINTTLVFAEIIFRHGDRYKGIDPKETYPNDPYAIEDPFWLPYGCDQLRNKGKMRSHWLGQYLRRRYSGFLPEEFYHYDVCITSADLSRCIDSAHVMSAGLYPPKGINIWNDNVGKYYQPIPVRTLHSGHDIFLNEEVTCPTYEKELKKVLTKKMKNFNKKYQYMYEYLEMYAGMSVKNLEDVAQIYTTLRIENENGRKLPDWVNLVFPTHLKMLNSYYNQIRYSSHFFKRTQAGPLLTVLMDELKQKSLNRLKPNYKMKFWSGFDTTILKLLYTMMETHPSLDKAEDLLETDYSGVLIIELHLINKKHFVKVLYINMDPSFWKSHAPRSIPICDGLTLCPLDTFLGRMTKYRVTQKQWFHQCNISYCRQEDQPDNSIKPRSI